MADVNIGGVWADVQLRFDKAQKQASDFASKMSPIAAAEKKVHKDASAAVDERIKKMHELLGITEKTNAADAAAAAKMSFLDRTMMKMGANIPRGGMMGAQLSYAAQDFLTGLAMGNINQAIMGASNNLGMMAMQISSAAAAWTTLGLVAIPMAITALKEFGVIQRQQINEAEELHKIFEQRRFGLQLDAKAQEALTEEEVKRMHGAANLQKHVQGEERSVEDLNSALKGHQKLLEEADLRSRGLGVSGGTLPAEDNDVKRYRKMQLDMLEAEKNQDRDTAEELRARRYELEKALLGRMGRGVGEYRLTETAGGGVEARKIVDKATREQAEKEVAQEKKTIAEVEEERKKRESNLNLLRKRRDEEARTELQYMQREANAGFNKYQKRKAEMERQEREERRQLRESGLGEIVVRPPITEEELKKRQEEIDETAVKEKQDNFNDMIKMRDRKRIRGRALTKAEQEEFSEREKAIEERRLKAREALEEERKPGTLLDPAMKALEEKQRIRRIEMAQEFTKGPRTTITGIAELYKHIQTGLGGDEKGAYIADQANAARKANTDALADLTKAVNELNGKSFPAKWGQ